MNKRRFQDRKCRKADLHWKTAVNSASNVNEGKKICKRNERNLMSARYRIEEFLFVMPAALNSQDPTSHAVCHVAVCVEHSFFFTVHKIWIIMGDSTHCFWPLDFYCTEFSVYTKCIQCWAIFLRKDRGSQKPVVLNICNMVYLHASTVISTVLICFFLFFCSGRCNSFSIQYFICLLYKMENCNFHIVLRYIPISVHDCRLYDAERFLAFRQTKPKICAKRIEPTIDPTITSFRFAFHEAPGASRNGVAKAMKMRIFVIPLEIISLAKTLSWPQNAIFARSNLTIFDVVVWPFSGMHSTLQ